MVQLMIKRPWLRAYALGRAGEVLSAALNASFSLKSCFICEGIPGGESDPEIYERYSLILNPEAGRALEEIAGTGGSRHNRKPWARKSEEQMSFLTPGCHPTMIIWTTKSLRVGTASFVSVSLEPGVECLSKC